MNELTGPALRPAHESITHSDWIRELWPKPAEQRHPVRRAAIATVIGLAVATGTPSAPMTREVAQTGSVSFFSVPRLRIVDTGERREVASTVGQHSRPIRAPGLAGVAMDAIDEIAVLTGLRNPQVAEQLIGVTRQAYYNWASGTTSITQENAERVLAVRDILRRAERYSAMLGRTVTEWLHTPHTEDGLTPLQLFKEGQLDVARRAATIQNLAPTSGLPDWVQNASTRHSLHEIDRGISVIVPEPEQVHFYQGEHDPE